MKKLVFYSFFILLIYSFVSCKNEPQESTITSNSQDSTIQEQTTPNILQLEGQPISLVVTTQKAIVRAAPSIEAAEIARFSKGDSLLFTNRISEFNTAMKLEGVAYNEPWLRIILSDNKMGWIYGACINFDATQQVQLKEKVLDQRAVALFGASLAQQIAVYQKEVKTARTLPAFRTLYSRAQLLKDSLEKQMNIYLKTAHTFPDFFWLNELMDGLLVHYIESQNKYYLFKDLRVWQMISTQTDALEDDQFVEVLLASYPSDSIAFYFYGWQLPVDSTTMCSLLGSNIHIDVLDKIGVALDSNGYFNAEIKTIKQALIDDIAVAEHYWMPLEQIQQELNAILQKKYTFLSSGDRIALKTRRQLLQKHVENNIAVNLFEGQ
ncbi:SH3 domain-containing protein [Aureispira sp. CCB-E]|uniref:SH3 domain-containing protein n=1 Tax=Aureispira sp. CCB-E TaxID=3051121 RepID=UPI002868C69D|nr:SH3 domain-containing protein [Aureispira sp. CCB-E]WMX13859.1 SH3 domain-containing protein [Aureispira sp. CCB-E]